MRTNYQLCKLGEVTQIDLNEILQLSKWPPVWPAPCGFMMESNPLFEHPQISHSYANASIQRCSDSLWWFLMTRNALLFELYILIPPSFFHWLQPTSPSHQQTGPLACPLPWQLNSCGAPMYPANRPISSCWWFLFFFAGQAASPFQQNGKIDQSTKIALVWMYINLLQKFPSWFHWIRS